MAGQDDDLARFLVARDYALLSLDEQTIRAFARSFNATDLPSDPEAFWRTVHKARSAAATLPRHERQRSIDWLRARGSEPWSDDPTTAGASRPTEG